MDAWLSVICYNTVEAPKKNAPKPVSWKDLTNPAFKGQIVMPNPASSGTGYLTIWGWMQAMGEAEAWKFMDALHENIGMYTHSGSAPCVQAARGERLVGIGFDMRGAREKSQGAPIDIILAKEGAGWDMEATAIVKGTKNLAAAQKLADWSISRKAYELYGKYYAIVGLPGLNPAPANYPANAEPAMVKVDLAAMGKERERILAEWMKRYDSQVPAEAIASDFCWRPGPDGTGAPAIGMTDDALARAARLPCWAGPVEPEILKGGITNANFLVRDRDNATSSASPPTFRCTASCGSTSWPRAAPRMPSAFHPRSCMRSPAPWCCATSTAVP